MFPYGYHYGYPYGYPYVYPYGYGSPYAGNPFGGWASPGERERELNAMLEEYRGVARQHFIGGSKSMEDIQKHVEEMEALIKSDPNRAYRLMMGRTLRHMQDPWA